MVQKIKVDFYMQGFRHMTIDVIENWKEIPEKVRRYDVSKAIRDELVVRGMTWRGMNDEEGEYDSSIVGGGKNFYGISIIRARLI